jgi:hypothetical protein
VVRAQRLDDDAVDRLRAADQPVGQASWRQLDDEIVHRAVRSALDDVQRQDVPADLAERRGDGAEHARPVGQHDAQEEGHAGQPAGPCCRGVAARCRVSLHG